MTVFDRIKSLAIQKGITISELERLTNISNGTISKWTNNSNPGSKNISAIADFFNVSVDYLLGREEKEYQVMYRLNTEGLDEKDTTEMQKRLSEFERLLRLDILERKKKDRMEG